MTRVAVCQLAPRVGEAAFNRAASLGAIGDAVAAGAQVIVLPELATSGYVFSSREELAALALDRDDPLLAQWAAAAGGAVLVAGFAERGAGGALHNSAAVLWGGRLRAVYRKTHLWDREKLFFTPGSEPPPVLDTPAGRIGVLVCYDLEFPELTRGLALRGAELIAVPTNWPLVPRPAGERPPEVVIAMAAARVNRVAIAACDRTGEERGVAWTAGSTIVGADGWIAAEVAGGGEGIALAELDLALARGKRLTAHADALGDRRPELYGELAAPPASAVDQLD